MTFEEFNNISGMTADQVMYDREIEPTYMEFDSITKKELSALYWGDKKGYYSYWLKANAMTHEKSILDDFVKELKNVGLYTPCYEECYEARKKELEKQIKNLRIV